MSACLGLMLSSDLELQLLLLQTLENTCDGSSDSGCTTREGPGLILGFSHWKHLKMCQQTETLPLCFRLFLALK